MQILLYAQTGKQSCRIALCIPSFKLSEFFLQLGGTYAILI